MENTQFHEYEVEFPIKSGFKLRIHGSKLNLKVQYLQFWSKIFGIYFQTKRSVNLKKLRCKLLSVLLLWESLRSEDTPWWSNGNTYSDRLYRIDEFGNGLNWLFFLQNSCSSLKCELNNNSNSWACRWDFPVPQNRQERFLWINALCDML